MDKVEKILEKGKIYIGVKDVKLVVRPYNTRSAFTKLSSPSTIYLNEHLIDDEEVVKYLIIRELIHIKLNMYPSSYRLDLRGEVRRHSPLLYQRRKLKRLDKDGKKLMELNKRLG